MRRLVIAMSCAALVAPATASADAALTGAPHTPRAHATVTPRRGTPSTTFAVRVRNPERTGTFAQMRVWEMVSAIGPKSTVACSGIASTSVPPAAAGARLRVRLAPSGKPWCAGPYVGTVSLYREMICQPGPVPAHRVCPMLAFAPERIGRFRFTVSAPRRS